MIGVLALGDRPGRQFHADEIVLAQGVVEQATLALENARLYAEARHANRARTSSWPPSPTSCARR